MKQLLHTLWSGLMRPLSRFARDDRGTATVEFALIFPVYIILLLSAFESGMLMTRQVMLERGLEMAMRDVRIGAMSPVTHDTLKNAICNNAGIIPNCADALKIEMRRVDLLNWTNLPAAADCIDRNDPAAPLVAFQQGGANQMVVVRACALFDPVFPTLGLGAQIPRETGNEYALVSRSAFVREP
ncbi:MAG: hypothetical protein RLZ60_1513 [Pseudomonadota bacterium]|jgi:Flp pilus assembly protein TadG|uniref:TadE/TadG family type IV pilus assembly protein n=1 Tax=Marivivens sp. TaxID=1978374 RepID=UPI00183F009D|nr:TadE/TadG family type IV pilus assembly protein [Marivivens sp.]NVJ95203.1 pilus assembly protein [Marivivens sp.]NVK07166.1 pilus assembly protein [Marivivens sp.]